MKYQKVMVPLDGSDLSECVLPHIEELAKGCLIGELLLARVCEPLVVLADYPPNTQEQWEAHVREESAHARQMCSVYLENIQKRLQYTGLVINYKVALGNPAEKILELAEQEGVDLIVMATHGRSGLTRWAFGSTANKVVRAAKAPVMLITARECRADYQTR